MIPKGLMQETIGPVDANYLRSVCLVSPPIHHVLAILRDIWVACIEDFFFKRTGTKEAIRHNGLILTR